LRWLLAALGLQVLLLAAVAPAAGAACFLFLVLHD